MFLNVEIKAKCGNANFMRNYPTKNNATFIGTDIQTDTYFNVPNGRLKLREGNIENNLIFYQRNNQAGPKDSQFTLTPVQEKKSLKAALTQALDIKVIVKKKREIYYIENVKFHIDEVENLGHFIEIEAGNNLTFKTKEELLAQCNFYIQTLGINETDLVTHSYSDLLIEKQSIG